MVDDNITQDDLETAAEMFVYLHGCPGIHGSTLSVEERWFEIWYLFYSELFRTKSPRLIILTLNRLRRKSFEIKEYDFKLNQKLLHKVVKVLSLKHENIGSLIPGNISNAKEEDQNIETSEEGGYIILYCYIQ